MICLHRTINLQLLTYIYISIYIFNKTNSTKYSSLIPFRPNYLELVINDHHPILDNEIIVHWDQQLVREILKGLLRIESIRKFYIIL